MIEFVLWVLFGSLCGWIGYLAARSKDDHAKPYLLVGMLAAVGGGIFARSMISVTGFNTVDLNSLIIALMTSAICMIAFGFLETKSSHHHNQ